MSLHDMNSVAEVDTDSYEFKKEALMHAFKTISERIDDFKKGAEGEPCELIDVINDIEKRLNGLFDIVEQVHALTGLNFSMITRMGETLGGVEKAGDEMRFLLEPIKKARRLKADEPSREVC